VPTDRPPPSPESFTLAEAESILLDEFTAHHEAETVGDLCDRVEQLQDQVFWLVKEAERQRAVIERLIQVIGG
jgi:hypothetical protein